MRRSAGAVGLWLLGVAVGVVVALAMVHVVDDDESSGESQAPASETQAPRVGVVTVNVDKDGSCTSQGPQTVAFGRYAIDFLNKSDVEVWVHVLRPADGVTYDDLAAHVADDHERKKGGDQTVGYEELAALEVSIPLYDERHLYRDGWGDIEPGTLGLLCEQWNSLSLAGPVEVVP
jgi:hypothetical protein